MMKRDDSAFTLIEILVVILIISILAGIVGVSVLRRPGEARAAAAELQIGIFKTALQMYHMDHGIFPTQAQGLEALCVKPSIPPVPETYPPEGYLEKRSVPLDPWGHGYIYIVPGRNNESYEIISYGSDGEPGGPGDGSDISSSNL